MKPPSIPFVQGQVLISYGMDEQGAQVITTAYTADGVDDQCPDFFTGLTMLEVAKLDFLTRHGLIQRREIDD